jgi:small subunit ribosomal protein S19
MAIREFRYRGKTLPELLKLDMKELTTLLPASARRKIKRGFMDAEKKFLREVQTNRKRVKTHCRDMLILPLMVGKLVSIHTGKEFRDVEITAEMIGHRLGEFAVTRQRVKHNAPGIEHCV